MLIQKILLIAPPPDTGRRKDYLIPYGLLSIAVGLRQNQYDVKVLNASFYVNEIKYLGKVISDYKPDIIGVGFPTDAFDSAAKIAKLAKEINQDIKIIAGGIHPTAMPEQTLTVPYFDYLVAGEGEIATLELIKALSDGKDVSNITGVWYRQNGNIINNLPRPEIANLDTIPFDNLDLLIDLEKYPKQVLGQIHTSRGCIYNCAYCSSQIIWGKKVRYRSVENILAELEYLYNKYKVRDVNFADDNFTLDPERVRKICNGIIQKGLKIHWRCCSRADIHKQYDLELLKIMKHSGCTNICIGFESGAQQILDRANRNIKIDEAKTLVKMVKDSGIKVHVDFIIGLPGENQDTLNQTLQLAKKIWQSAQPTMSVAIFKAYPGTSVYERNEFPDLKGLGDKIKETFNYAETCNIKNLSGNTKYIRNRIAETITSPRDLLLLFKKTVIAWTKKND